MKIRTMVLASAMSLALLLGVGGVNAFSNINEIRIGGPLQRQGQETSDLVADILPPPEYIIEPYLEATLLRNAPATYQVHAARLADLRKAYDDRHRYWLNSTLDAPLRATITQSSHAPAMRFWQDLDGDFLPAVRSGDTARIDASYGRLTAAYSEHRAAIDHAVAAATDYQTKLSAQSKAVLHRSLVLLAVIGLLVLAGVAGFCWLILQRLVSPMTAIARTMTRMSAGDLDGVIPGQDRSDEVGEVARAIVGFKAAEVV
jgi:methyl-accepting chemotaxis protein